ncbi:MAG: phosphoglycerate kinase [Bacteriovoracaceae bacterium]|nr:phosphoglycerate kinase [Bacteriovoracaceae bacterium]
MALKYIDQMDLQGKRVIGRFDFNVPLNESGKITDTTRIDKALPTINYILENGAKTLVLMSHLGRPKGEAKAEFSLEPVATYLAEQLGVDVVLTESCKDKGIRTLLELPGTKVILLQNLRFHKEETENDLEFSKMLAQYGDIYVNDAFGAAHRKHASTYGINAYFPRMACGGFLMKAEVEALQKIVDKPQSPFVAIVGGAKVTDKIKIIERLLTNVDSLLIGGAMAYPFLKAKGYEVGTSLCSDEDVKLAKNILTQSSARKLVLPVDHVCSKEFGGAPVKVSEINIPSDLMGLDIGEQTIAHFREKLSGAKTVLWNGPMGLFENENFAAGTFEVANILAGLKDAFTLVGGGDSVSAVNKSGLSSKMSHVSTGGGASLEFIENGSLPGVQALKFGLN